MARNITLKIAGKEFPIVAQTPEMEARMRTGAEEINEMLIRYDSRFPTMSLQDKLVFIALNQATAKLAVQDGAKELATELSDLVSNLGTYLEGVEKNR